MRPPTTRPWPPTGSSADDAECHRTHRQHQHPRPTPSDAHRDLLEPDAGTTRTSGSEGAPARQRAGATRRGPGRRGGRQTQLVCVYDHAQRLVLTQSAVVAGDEVATFTVALTTL